MEQITHHQNDQTVIDLRDTAIERFTPSQHDALLHDYLGADYEFAQSSGLIDTFYYNPETGEDTLIHILAGDVIIDPSGAKEVAGYHHEPSSRGSDTYVDLAPLEGKNGKALREYRRFPYEPYNAFTVIKGYPKKVLRKDEAGKIEEHSAHSSMFPKEYDPLAIMQAIRMARDNRDRTKDEPGRKNTIVTEGNAPLIDEENTMRLRLILDRDTEQVVTAFPLSRSVGIMKLSEAAIKQYLGLE